MNDSSRQRGLRLRRLRLLGASGTGTSYDVEFLDEVGDWRELAVIAGPSQTGKTSIVDFVRYCLGGAAHPQHPEILRSVRVAQLELEVAGQVTTIERTASGEPSSYASVWEAGIDDLASVPEIRLSTDTSDDAGLSQFLLASFELDHVELPEAPSRADSPTQTLSIRDAFRIMWLPNDRIDSNNLAFEHSDRMVGQKFRQTIDLIFGVLDAQSGVLTAQIAAASTAARQAQAEAAALRAAVSGEYPSGPTGLEATVEDAARAIRAATGRLAEVDATSATQDQRTSGLRQHLSDAESAVRQARLRVEDRRSLLLRLESLREQYADDKRKLMFLSQAERLFDPLQVEVCPACLSSIESVHVEDGHCSLCRTDLPAADATEANSAGGTEEGASQSIAAELRATSRKLDELQQYFLRLETGLAVLEQAHGRSVRQAEEAASAVDSIVDLPAPFLAVRDALSQDITESRIARREARAGLRMWARVSSAEARADLLGAQASRLRKERSAVEGRPDRRAVVRQLSDRFGKILLDFSYPKLSQAQLDDRLVPHVRGLPYEASSSGGHTLISLAWYLALWEIAWEQDGLAPGLLMIDSPQKNLGHNSIDDADFADADLVENFYAHIRSWQQTEGAGTQVIIVDNSPPPSVADTVVVRYTRSAETPPYGLITDAVD